MPESEPLDLSTTFLRLRTDASVEALPVDGHFWQRVAAGELGAFHNEFLVSSYSFDADWPTWEMHPNGDEIVCLLSGSVRFELELPQAIRSIKLTRSGSYVVVPKGTWHTAKVAATCRMLFITAGEGTEHREAQA